jgi:hypothetical protein
VVAKFRPIILIFFCLMQPISAQTATEQPTTIPILIEPECKDMFYGPDFLYIDSNGK